LLFAFEAHVATPTRPCSSTEEDSSPTWRGPHWAGWCPSRRLPTCLEFRLTRRPSASLASCVAPRRKNSERLLSTDFHLVRVKASRIAGSSPVWRSREPVAASDRERTLADALVHPSWVGGVRRLTEMMGRYRASREFDPQELLIRIDEVGVGAAYKRLGYLAEVLWPDVPEVAEHARARRSTGTIRLEPSIADRGKMVKRWGLWVNVAIVRDEAE
jgi:predicted transcriptional regulator of viral defense system